MWRLTHGADDFVVPFVTDENDRVTLFGVAHCFQMYLCDQRAGGVDGPKSPALCCLTNSRGNAVGAVQYRPAFRDFLHRIDEYYAFLDKLLHDRPIVHDLVVSVNRRVE